jgi:hypothetical protein
MTSSENMKEVVQSDLNDSSDEQSPTASFKDPPSERPVHGFKWFLVCVSLYIGALIYGLDTTIAADIQAAIVERFDNVERLTWVGTAFPLGSVCAILPM